MTALTVLINKLSCYLGVGLINTLICFTVMYLGALSGLNYLQYTALGYVIAIFFSFFMNLRYTFQVQGHLAKRLAWFLVISVSNLLFVELIEYTLIELVVLNKLIAIFCGMSCYVILGFLFNNFLVYRGQIGAKA